MAKDVSAVFTGVIIIAIVAVIASSSGTGDFVKAAGKLLAGLATIVVSPGTKK